MNHKNPSRLIASALLFSLAALGVPRAMADNAVPGQPTAASPSAMTTVLPPKEAEALFKFYFDGDTLFGKQDRHHRLKETYWTPTAADVAQAELALADDAKTKIAVPYTTTPQDLVLTEYFRQYAGVMRGDKKCILINAVEASPSYKDVTNPSPKPGSGWHDRAILIFDGGSAFFHASYNLDTHQIANIQFNGIG